MKQQAVALRNQVGPLAKSDPARAIALVDEFLHAHPDAALSDAALLVQLKAGAQREGLRDAGAALQTYRAARAGFSSQPQPKAAWAEADLVRGEAEILLAQKDAAGAAALLAEQWPLIARSNANRESYAFRSTEGVVKTYVQALDASGHKAEVPDILAGHLLQAPELLSFRDQASDLGALLVEIITQRLTKSKRDQEAERWARLRYATCAYGVEALDGATLFLGKTWRNTERTRAFGEAQSDAGKPNPLRETELPALLSGAMARGFVEERAHALEDEMAQTGDAGLVPDLVGLYLASGKVGAAMEWAWRGAQANKGEPESAAQVCRVFKAADLDLVRAQGFLAWVAGKGENPVPQFIAEHPAEAELPAAALKARRERNTRQKAALAGEWQDVLEAPRGVKLGLVNLGALEPQQAWEAGALPVEDTIRLIQEQRVRGWMSVPEREVIRLALGEVLDQQLAALPEKERPLVPPLVQLALADTKRKRGDAGAVPIYQELIAAAEKRNEKGFDRQSIVPLAHLAMFYSEQEQYVQAAQTWGRWKDVPTSDEWQADWRIEAARAYAKAGDAEQAKQLYTEVPQYGHGLYTGLAFYDQAYTLIQSDKHAEARVLLQTLVTGTNAATAQVGLLSLLAASYLKTGEVDLAQSTARKALETYKTLKNPESNAGLAPQVERAQKILDWCERYQKQK